MAVRRVLDTNVALYLLSGKLAEPLGSAEYFTSVITELELLSYPNITTSEEKKINTFLRDVTLVGLNAEIRNATIRIRRDHKLRLPDAIICATASVLDAELLSNDVKLGKVTGLHVSPVRLKSS